MANAQVQMFVSLMEGKGMNCRVDDENNLVRTGWSLDNTELSLIFDFSDEGYASIIGYDFIKVPEEKFDKVLWALNACNRKYRFVKFTLDEKDKEVMLKIDAVVQLDTCAEEMFELMVRAAQIVDDAYPDIMKALWG